MGLLQKALGTIPDVGDTVTATVTLRICGVQKSTSNSDYSNSIDAELVSMDGAADTGKAKEEIEPAADDMAEVDESDDYEAEPA